MAGSKKRSQSSRRKTTGSAKSAGASGTQAVRTKKNAASAASAKKSQSFRDRLGRLTTRQAVQMLGDDGEALLRRGGQRWNPDPEEDVYLGGDLFRVRINDFDAPGGKAIVVITQISGRRKTLHLTCDQCETPCEHAGAALDLLLREKMLLGLSAAPDESVPLELLTDDELHQRAIAEREERAATEKMTVRSISDATPWADYIVTSHVSGKSYRVALRGDGTSQSYCSCPDFRTNHLGTCKHILHTLRKITRRFSRKELSTPYRRLNTSLRVDYGEVTGLRFNLPHDRDDAIREFAEPYENNTLSDAHEAMLRVRGLEVAGHDVHIYPDAEEWIERRLAHEKLQEATADMRRNPAKHPLRKSLLKVELLPYQMEGIAFAAGAGRAVLADDMGLGKTIQGIGTAELLAQIADVRRVLVVCPASLKSQWRDEIHRFCDRSVQLIIGNATERSEQYQGDEFFTICNYEQVMRDLAIVESVEWDMIILDEGQRIKNWESKTSQVIRSLRSRFALVLSGTPLENRLDELYTVIKFVDERLLGPAYRFFHKHRVVEDTGRVKGYRNLDDLRELLRPILLRRTRAGVLDQLPERTDTIIRVTPTAEQLEIHDGFMLTVAQITRKKFLTEMDLLRLQKSLLMARMAADSSYLVTKEEPEYSSKLDSLTELLEQLNQQPDAKIVLFSEWRRMLSRIEQRLEGIGMPFVRLDGQVPQKQRAALVNRFQTDPECRVILMTNAGSTGLNLQSANTVINVDLPWNPAILEQRIARAHRMGQKNPVQVYLMVTENTLEERLLVTLDEKRDLAEAALDAESDVCEVQFSSGIEELKRRLEKILGNTPDAPIDESQQAIVEQQAVSIQKKRDKVAAASGQLLGAALQLLGELVAKDNRPAADESVINRLRESLNETVERDAGGRPQLRITLPDDAAIGDLAKSLAGLLVSE